MKAIALLIGFFFLTAFNTRATVRYVNVNSVTPAPPFISWATAATNIQDAVDVAAAGDEIVVTNGVYAAGGRAVHGTMTNRVAVDKPLTLRSVNGPQFTIIQGHQVPGTTNGDGAIRCVYLTNKAILSGFTLTNGATRATNDYFLYRESAGGGVHCEALQSYLDPPTVVSNCIIVGNSAFGPGGGVYGGGVSSAQIINSELRGNTAQAGGGVAEGWIKRCVIADNVAQVGGGASEAAGEAGGFEYYSCKLDNSLLVGNRAQYNGGGAYSCELNNCTVVGNHADLGGGLYGVVVIVVQHPSRAVNSVVYSNTASMGQNFYSYVCNFENSCTAPLPEWGSGNITNTPLFVDFTGGDFRLQPDSPCINTGTNYYAPVPFDLDGNPRVRSGTVDMGAFEFQQGSTGLVHYVNLLSTNPVSPYLSWTTAATNIQDAINTAAAGDEIVVTNGRYAAGVVVTKALSLRSVNGSQSTIIDGLGQMRCVYLVNGSSLSGFTLTNGSAWNGGAGVWCEFNQATVSNCLVTRNTGTGISGCLVYNSVIVGNSGGGASYSTLNNCLITGNTNYYGGGALMCPMNNCTVVSNTAIASGGGSWSTNGPINNCIIYYNNAPSNPNWDGSGYRAGPAPQSHCCTTPEAFGSTACITNPPQFVDPATGNYRLQPTSPCINAGTNDYAPNPLDLDGKPRIVGGKVDIGAYEFQSTQPGLSIAQTGSAVLLSWPLWAGDFDLQQTSVLPPVPSAWTDVPTTPVITNNQNTVSLPITAEPRLFRLFKSE